jgi:ribosome-associated translation inhibitor RaiA
MKVSVRFSNLNPRVSWQRLIEAQLSRLEAFGEIASARVRVEQYPEAHPTFRVTVFLEVPGPDFHAEAADHTLAAAILKVVAALERQMKSRKRQQVFRHKANGQLRACPARSPVLAGSRA